MVSGIPRPGWSGRFDVADGRDRYQDKRKAIPPQGHFMAGAVLALVIVQFIVAQEPSRRNAEVRSKIVSESGRPRKSREALPRNFLRVGQSVPPCVAASPDF